MFKIKIEKAEPESVKISKKNVCIVKIAPATQMQSRSEEHTSNQHTVISYAVFCLKKKNKERKK